MKYDIKISLPFYKIIYSMFFIIILVFIRAISSASEIIAAVEPFLALLAGIFMCDNYYKEFVNDRIQVFYRYSIQKKYRSIIRACIINWLYLMILVILSYGGYLLRYAPVNFTTVSTAVMFINTLAASGISMLFIGVLSFTITNFTQNIGMGIGITFIIWGCLNTTVSQFIPKFLQLFLLEEDALRAGVLKPYYMSRIIYLFLTVLLLLINRQLLLMQPKYKKKGSILKHGN